MALKPWQTVITPREDLREGRPLDASEFAVHLDAVHSGNAPKIYTQPEQFIRHTYLTRNLIDLAAGVVRRLSGIMTETSAIYNMTTQFGGGKTHALTLLYHLAKHGPAAGRWPGVDVILERAGVSSVPQAAVAIFVGTEFDSLTGRGGEDGTPLRKTPWGEIAYQLGGEASFAVVAEHDRTFTEPKGDVIRAMFPKDKPCLILMDEIINYVSTYRRHGYHNALYNFIQSLSETARSLPNVTLVVSIPASELSYTDADESDQRRFQHMLDRLGKAIMISSDSETSEIIRRRLFTWDEHAITREGKVILSRDALDACRAYAQWAQDNRQQLPMELTTDDFAATYPFHPALISVFERKWQALPRFQRTRGVLRMLALWVSHAYTESYRSANRDAMIGLGTAPLGESMFRSALFEQLGGEDKLEAAVTTDIAGRGDSHAVRLDQAAADILKKARLHRKVATAIFFESNGGSLRTEATIPEIRLAVGEPGLDIGNVETALEALADACYYLEIDRNKYRFSISPNLNKILADRRAGIKPDRVDECLRAEIQKAFTPKQVGDRQAVERRYFPLRSSDIPDRPVLSVAVLSPDERLTDAAVQRSIDTMTREHGASGRTFKTGLIWAVADDPGAMQESAKKLLALQDIRELDLGALGDVQQRRLVQDLQRAESELKQAVWRAYRNVLLLGRDNTLRKIDLGLVSTSSAGDMIELIINRLRSDDEVVDFIQPTKLAQYWPALSEWSTKAVRDAFYSSPLLPRIIRPDALKDTIAKGVAAGVFAYAGKYTPNEYEPFYFRKPISAADIEIADDVVLLRREDAEAYLHRQTAAEEPEPLVLKPTAQAPSPVIVHEIGPDFQVTPEPPVAPPPPTAQRVPSVGWSGAIPPQKWMTFYTKVLSHFVQAYDGVTVTVGVDIRPGSGLPQGEVESLKAALRELGLDDETK
jgi:hypothetical protein